MPPSKGFRKPKGEKDDLKLISTIEPELETSLNKLNILKYEQIAAFSDDDIANIDEALRLDGRIEKEDWISQAQRLMAEATVEEVPEQDDAETADGDAPEPEQGGETETKES